VVKQITLLFGGLGGCDRLIQPPITSLIKFDKIKHHLNANLLSIIRESGSKESTTMVGATFIKDNFSLEDFMTHPPNRMEWVDGQLLEKNGMTIKHGKIQLRLGTYWQNYKDTSGQGGEVYTDVPCRTNKQGRSPDVAYLTPQLVGQFGNVATLPQSFPLCAEIISPTDLAENVLLKAQEYLESGGEEVWLVFPDSRWVIVMTEAGGLMFASGQVASSQKVLKGFSVPVDELFA
jgi:Uma2 family endonuclease